MLKYFSFMAFYINMILRLCLIFFLFTAPCSGIQLLPKIFSKEFYVEPPVYDVDSFGDEQGVFDFDNFYNKFVYDLIPDTPTTTSTEKDIVESYANTNENLINRKSNQPSPKKNKEKKR